MPDTRILKAPGGWPPHEEITEVSERELREWMADISKDLKASIAQQATHSQESAVYKATTDARLKEIEGHMERRSALKSGTIMAGIGALAGAVAAAIGKKTGLWILPLMILVGCGVTSGAKEANSQNGHIGILVEEKGVTLADPALAQMGKDVAANAATVGNEIGNPSVDKPYSPENSAAARESAAASLRAREEGASTLWQIASAVAGFVGVGGIVGWLRSALASAKLATFAKVATSVVEGVPDLKKKFAEKAVAKGVAGIVDKVVQDNS